MAELMDVMLVAGVLWTAFILYLAYIDSKVRRLEGRLKR